MGSQAHHISQPREWDQSRLFDVSERYGENTTPDEAEVRDLDEIWTYVACDDDTPSGGCNCRAPHLDSIVIAVDGACRGNGTPLARAAVGVFVATSSIYNESRRLTGPVATNQIAELEAGVLGLEKALEIKMNRLSDHLLQHVVIKSDSEYLVRGMTDWVFKWEKNGYRSAKRTLVVNSALFQKLQKLVSDLNSIGVEVLFWHVRREFNKEADKLANESLLA